MRPVEKRPVGNCVKYVNSNRRIVSHVIQPNYVPYSGAKDALAGCIGTFCSYCEDKKSLGDLAVEHVAPKSQGGATADWDNFLLSCGVCNSDKGIGIVSLTDCHFPHRNNTFLSLVYDCGGRVLVNSQLSGDAKKHAEKLLELVELRRYPHSPYKPSPRDFRWRNRYEAWNIAVRCKLLLDNGNISLHDIIKMARRTGFWSVWFTVFKGYDNVRWHLIEGFPGTCKSCFDSSNHYEPVPRNPQNTNDPV